MTVDSVITLDNDVNCLLLEKVTHENENYFLSVVLNEDEEPSDEYVIFKEIIEDNEKLLQMPTFKLNLSNYLQMK